MRKLPGEIIAWLREMNRLTQFGLMVIVVGAVIDLIYHGVLTTLLVLPSARADIVQYVGHVITFIGMLIMLLGVFSEGRNHSRAATTLTDSKKSSVFISPSPPSISHDTRTRMISKEK